MIDLLIEQLLDPNPAVRKRAIMSLAKTKNLAAVKPLASVVRNDPVPELRELALKAGQYIRQQAAQQTRPSMPHVTPFKELIDDNPDENEYFEDLGAEVLIDEIETMARRPFIDPDEIPATPPSVDIAFDPNPELPAGSVFTKAVEPDSQPSAPSPFLPDSSVPETDIKPPSKSSQPPPSDSNVSAPPDPVSPAPPTPSMNTRMLIDEIERDASVKPEPKQPPAPPPSMNTRMLIDDIEREMGIKGDTEQTPAAQKPPTPPPSMNTRMLIDEIEREMGIEPETQPPFEAGAPADSVTSPEVPPAPQRLLDTGILRRIEAEAGLNPEADTAQEAALSEVPTETVNTLDTSEAPQNIELEAELEADEPPLEALTPTDAAIDVSTEDVELPDTGEWLQNVDLEADIDWDDEPPLETSGSEDAVPIEPASPTEENTEQRFPDQTGTDELDPMSRAVRQALGSMDMSIYDYKAETASDEEALYFDTAQDGEAGGARDFNEISAVDSLTVETQFSEIEADEPPLEALAPTDAEPAPPVPPSSMDMSRLLHQIDANTETTPDTELSPEASVADEPVVVSETPTSSVKLPDTGELLSQIEMDAGIAPEEQSSTARFEDEPIAAHPEATDIPDTSQAASASEEVIEEAEEELPGEILFDEVESISGSSETSPFTDSVEADVVEVEEEFELETALESEVTFADPEPLSEPVQSVSFAGDDEDDESEFEQDVFADEPESHEFLAEEPLFVEDDEPVSQAPASPFFEDTNEPFAASVPPFPPEIEITEPEPAPKPARKPIRSLSESEPKPAAPVAKPLFTVDKTNVPASTAGAAATVAAVPFSIVRGHQFDIPREDRIRAKEYLNSAMAMSMNGDNARALKDLTSALGLDPNLINDGFFNNVASVVTGLEGDAATQVIIDQTERKRFTANATQSQKEKRVEQHLNIAEGATWGDVWFEVILYTIIVILGPIFAALVTVEMSRNLLNNFPEVSGNLPAPFQNAEMIATAFSVSSLLPIGIVSGVSGVLSLLLQTAIIHYAAKLFGGIGTWRHLVRLMIGFYNKWLPLLFLLLYITTAVAFVSLLSPIVLCFVLALVILTLYVSSKTASKIGEAYDFGTAKGCLSLMVSLVVIGIINGGIYYLLLQSLGWVLSNVVG